MLIVSEKKLENARMELEIEVPGDNIKSEYEKVFTDFQKNAKIDGFRKGKVPREIILKRFKASADVEVAENIVKTAYLDALKEKNLSPISQPEINFEGKIESDKPFKFNVKFDIAPTVQLGDYKNITVKETDSKIEEEDVEREIQSLRERYATVTKKEKDEQAGKGDYVRAQVKRIDNVEKSESDKVVPQNISLIVGKEKTDYSFDEDIIGMRVDEEKETGKKYPKDYHDKELAGQKVKYLLKILEISRLTLPELDDEFAKDLGQFSTLEEVRNKIREDLGNFVTEKVKKSVNEDLMNKIIENSKFDLPESIIVQEMDAITARIENGMGVKQGEIDELFKNGAINKDDFLKRVRDDAERNIKSTLILAEIAKAENIRIPEDKYKEFIKTYSERTNKSSEEVEKIIEENGSKRNIETELLLNSASEFIYNNANIKKQKPVSFEEFRKL